MRVLLLRECAFLGSISCGFEVAFRRRGAACVRLCAIPLPLSDVLPLHLFIVPPGVLNAVCMQSLQPTLWASATVAVGTSPLITDALLYGGASLAALHLVDATAFSRASADVVRVGTSHPTYFPTDQCAVGTAH
jgi:hypothetical protein